MNRAQIISENPSYTMEFHDGKKFFCYDSHVVRLIASWLESKQSTSVHPTKLVKNQVSKMVYYIPHSLRLSIFAPLR